MVTHDDNDSADSNNEDDDDSTKTMTMTTTTTTTNITWLAHFPGMIPEPNSGRGPGAKKVTQTMFFSWATSLNLGKTFISWASRTSASKRTRTVSLSLSLSLYLPTYINSSPLQQELQLLLQYKHTHLSDLLKKSSSIKKPK